MEDIKQAWVPIWVKLHPDNESGNAALVRAGARWLPEGAFEVSALFANRPTSSMSEAPTLFDQMQSDVGTKLGLRPEAVPSTEPAAEQRSSVPGTEKPAPLPASFYDYFLLRLKDATRERPLEPEVLQEHFGVSKSQLNEWVKRAVEEGTAEKLTRPVRYQWRQPKAGQQSLFGEGDGAGTSRD